MGQIKVLDSNIWAKHIEDDAPLKELILNLAPGALIDLEVGGIAGRWAKANSGKDGRATAAIKPVGTMKEVWKDFFAARRGTFVTIRQTQLADSYLAALAGTLSEWDSAEDNEAFRDL
ncbi:MAG: hypothetical protein WDO17_22640 [Alphaproteobacteria bacterium]